MTVIIGMIVAFLVGMVIPCSVAVAGILYFKKHPEMLAKAAARKFAREMIKSTREGKSA